MTKEMFCPDCEQRTEFQKIAGKWICVDCGCELADEEQSEEVINYDGFFDLVINLA
jgi:ribosomal protein L37AE/L43A